MHVLCVLHPAHRDRCCSLCLAVPEKVTANPGMTAFQARVVFSHVGAYSSAEDVRGLCCSLEHSASCDLPVPSDSICQGLPLPCRARLWLGKSLRAASRADIICFLSLGDSSPLLPSILCLQHHCFAGLALFLI